ncbi:MAG: Cof-type HAD-IIB family hydrolase [Lactobacillus sp.]
MGVKIKIRLIGVDLDGTLLTSGKKIAKLTQLALKKAQAQGITVVPVSGRPVTGVRPHMQTLGLPADNPLILYNGAEAETMAGKVLFAHCFDAKQADVFSKFAQETGSQLLFMHDDGYYTLDQVETPFIKHLASMNFTYYLHVTEIPRQLHYFKAEYTGTPKQMDAVMKKVPPVLGQQFEILRTGAQIVECNLNTTSKGKAGAELAARLKIPQKEVMVFGDHRNDLSLFSDNEFFKVAMGNGVVELKDKADFVTRTNDNNGIAYALNEFVL